MSLRRRIVAIALAFAGVEGRLFELVRTLAASLDCGLVPLWPVTLFELSLR